MCGISGFIDYQGKSQKQTLQNMTDALHHRGPDDSGYSFATYNKIQIALGHRRLSILDLTTHGHQPMQYQDVELIYNGEVYNFTEIQEELRLLGYHFNSHSDTEVILKAYHHWGLKALEKFNGMFAIALWDKKKEKFYLIRDRAGVKPLYYYHDREKFLFSSELKSFHQNPDFQKKIDYNALALFLQYQYIPEPHTIFQNCYKLKAGHYLEIDLNTQEMRQYQYWSVLNAYNKPKLDISIEEAITESEKILTSAFEYRMVSDVPVGIFLSGGYDSSIVTALLQKNSSKKLKTFTIGFHEKGYDETPYARAVAKHLGTEHTEYYCTQKDALDIIPKLCEIYDEPFADPSAIPTTLVSQLAKKEVTVALSADGGDEIFAGYNKYNTAINYHHKFSKIPSFSKPAIRTLMNSINPNYIPFAHLSYNFATKYEKSKYILNANSSAEVMHYTSQKMTESELQGIIKETFKIPKSNFDNISALEAHNSELDTMLAIDHQTYMLDDILTKVDRASMHVSLEGREPLLDYRIIEFVASLPSTYKNRNGVSKYILKEITHKYLPKSLMQRPKMGFGVPLIQWFRDELKEYFETYLNEERLAKEGIFNAKVVSKMKDSYLKGEKVSIETLWSLLIFELWYERWMKP